MFKISLWGGERVCVCREIPICSFYRLPCLQNGVVDPFSPSTQPSHPAGFGLNHTASLDAEQEKDVHSLLLRSQNESAPAPPLSQGLCSQHSWRDKQPDRTYNVGDDTK